MQGTQRGITVSRSSEGVAAQPFSASLHECKGSTLQLHVVYIFLMEDEAVVCVDFAENSN